MDPLVTDPCQDNRFGTDFPGSGSKAAPGRSSPIFSFKKTAPDLTFQAV